MDTTNIVKDSLTQGVKTITEQTVNSTQNESTNIWLIIAIIEFIIIIGFIINSFIKTNTKKARLKEEIKAKDGEVDFTSMQNNFYKAKPLYDKLIKICHPDRFPNDETKQQIALELSQQIAKNKVNYQRLIELEQEIINKLNITFK